MTAKEMARLIAWLLSKGFTNEEADECLNFIAYGNAPRETPKDNKEE